MSIFKQYCRYAHCTRCKLLQKATNIVLFNSNVKKQFCIISHIQICLNVLLLHTVAFLVHKKQSTIQTPFCILSAALCTCVYVLNLTTSQDNILSVLNVCEVPHWPNIMLNSSGWHDFTEPGRKGRSPTVKLWSACWNKTNRPVTAQQPFTLLPHTPCWLHWQSTWACNDYRAEERYKPVQCAISWHTLL